MRKRLKRCALAAAAGLALVGNVSVASAHTTLVASDPPPGVVLDAVPTSVRATFDEAPESAFAALTVLGPDGASVSAGAPRVSGSQLSVDILAAGVAGTYTTNYRLMAADGHVITGSWSFTVAPRG